MQFCGCGARQRFKTFFEEKRRRELAEGEPQNSGLP